MNRNSMMVALALCAGLAAGTAYAKLPAAAPQTDAQKAEAAAKAKAAADKEAELNTKYQDKAAANYKKNKGIAEPKAAAMAAKKK
jgi:hypothetical protein